MTIIRRLGVFKNFMLRTHARTLAYSEDPVEAAKALSDIIAVVAADREGAQVLKRFGAGPEAIGALYAFLVEGGADRWIHGNYVAALSITNPIVLHAYLRDRHRAGEVDFKRAFADCCIRYIEGGYTESFLFSQLAIGQEEWRKYG